MIETLRKYSPEAVSLFAIMETSENLLTSVQFHIDRNHLGLRGSGILACFDVALDRLQAIGVLDEVLVREGRKALKVSIKRAGQDSFRKIRATPPP